MKVKLELALLIALFIAFIPAKSFSQSADSLTAKKVVISTSLLDYFPSKLNTGNFNIGSELYLKNRKSLYANIGLIKSYGPSGGWFSISSESTTGFKVQFEGRHYLNKHKLFQPAILLFWPHIFQFNSKTLQNSGYYVAVHSSFQSTVTERRESVDTYIGNDQFIYWQNYYSVNRDVYALNVKFGYQCIKKGGITVDYAVGLGGQYISSSSDDVIGRHNGNDIPWNKPFDRGSKLYPSFIYQVRVGWGF